MKNGGWGGIGGEAGKDRYRDEKLKDEARKGRGEREKDRDGRSRQGICSRHGYLLGGYIVYIPGTHFIRGSARDTLCRA